MLDKKTTTGLRKWQNMIYYQYIITYMISLTMCFNGLNSLQIFLGPMYKQTLSLLSGVYIVSVPWGQP
jgi:hypothetical protein